MKERSAFFQTDCIFAADGTVIQPLLDKMEEFFADKWAQVQLFMTSNSSNSTGVRHQQQSVTASSPFPGCAATNSSSNNCEEETMSTTLSIYEQKLLEQFNQVHAFI